MQSIEEIRQSVLDCKKCYLRDINNTLSTDDNSYGLPVPGIGSPTARIMFVGEAPGADEVRQGKPFVGKAGNLLREAISASGLEDRGDLIYISNVIKCRPEKNVFPSDSKGVLGCVNICLPYLIREFILIKPLVVVSCGNKPLQFLLKQDRKISDVMGNKIKINMNQYNFTSIVIPTMHPSFCLRPGMKYNKSEDSMSRGELMMSISPSQKQDIFFKHIKMAVDLMFSMMEDPLIGEADGVQ